MTMKSWSEKFATSRPCRTRVQESPFADLVVGQMVVIPGASDVDRAIRQIPSGDVWGNRQLRDRVAEFNDADDACPAVTGIQLRIISELVIEQLASGRTSEEVTPFWRVVEPDSKLAQKLPDGRRWITRLREEEQAA